MLVDEVFWKTYLVGGGALLGPDRVIKNRDWVE